MNRTLLLVLAVASLVTGGAGFVAGSLYIERLRETPGSSSEPDPEYLQVPADAKSPWMTGFTLTERSGKEVQWKELEGQVSVTSFFFSSCPALCLQQNQKVREIQRSYQGKGVVFVSITCDPDIDTPTRLREYADKLQADHKQWLFLTGELTYIRRVAGELFRVPMDKQTHSERLFVADKWGNVRDSFHWNKLDEVTKLKLLVDKLLAETEEPEEFREKATVETTDTPTESADSAAGERGASAP